MKKIQVEVTEEEYQFLKEQCEEYFPNRVGKPRLSDGKPRRAGASAKYICERIIRKWMKIKKRKIADAKESGSTSY